MIVLEDILAQLALDRAALEDYVAHAWVRPLRQGGDWRFDEIDAARLRLVHHLRRDMAMNDDAMDIALNLLDQLYLTRERMRRLQGAIDRQPEEVREKLRKMLEK